MSANGETLRVGVVQMNTREDKQANIAAALRLIDRAAAEGARLIALPEVWTYMGDPAGSFGAAEPVPGPITDLLAERARRHGVWIHGGSYVEKRDGEARLFNTTCVFDPQGNLVARYSKIHMFDVELDGVAVYQESAVVAPGDEIVTFACDGFTVGLTICYDVRFPELYRILALRGAEVIMHPAAFTMTTGKDHWETLIRARAIENTVYMVSPAQYGEAGGRWTYGRAMVVNPWGTVLATAPDEETVIHASIDRAFLAKIRRQVPSLKNRQPAVYRWPDAASSAD